MAMKTLLKALAVIILAALGAGGVLYLDGKCPQKQAKIQEQLNEAIAGYIKNNPQPILESLAKSENFGNVIKSFSNVSDEEINDKIQTFLANNPSVLEDYIRNNTAFIAETVTSSDTIPARPETIQRQATMRAQICRIPPQHKIRPQPILTRNFLTIGKK